MGAYSRLPPTCWEIVSSRDAHSGVALCWVLTCGVKHSSQPTPPHSNSMQVSSGVGPSAEKRELKAAVSLEAMSSWKAIAFPASRRLRRKKRSRRPAWQHGSDRVGAGAGGYFLNEGSSHEC